MSKKEFGSLAPDQETSQKLFNAFPIPDGQARLLLAQRLLMGSSQERMTNMLFRAPEMSRDSNMDKERQRQVEIRTQQLGELLSNLLAGKLDVFNPNMTQEEYDEIEKAFAAFLLLGVPYFNPISSPIVQAQIDFEKAIEEHSDREWVANTEKVWCSQPTLPNLYETYVDTSTAIAKSTQVLFRKPRENWGKDEVSAIREGLESLKDHVVVKMTEARVRRKKVDPNINKQLAVIEDAKAILGNNGKVVNLSVEQVIESLNIFVDDAVENVPDEEYSKMFLDLYKNILYSGVVDHHLIVARFAINSLERIQQELRQKIEALTFMENVSLSPGENDYPNQQDILPLAGENYPTRMSTLEKNAEEQGTLPSIYSDKARWDALPLHIQTQLKVWKKVLSLNPRIMAIFGLTHDIGRLITHDFFDHETYTRKILEAAGIAPEFLQEPTPIPFLIGELLAQSVKNIALGVIEAEDDHTEQKNEDVQKKKQYYAGIEALFMQLFDFFGKADVEEDLVAESEDGEEPEVIGRIRTGVRKPTDAADVIIRQDLKYKEGNVQLPDVKDRRLNYSKQEKMMVNALLLWLEDNIEGLALDREFVTSLFDDLKKIAKAIRDEYGILPY